MKVLAAILLVIGAASAGSGPYLPSGWKPSGPAFLLPGEVQKATDNPLKDLLQVEPAGSDSLREYGAPDIIVPSQDQRLPEITTEQPFLAINAHDSSETVSENLELVIPTVDTTEQIEEKDAVTEIVAELDEVTAQAVTNIESETESNDQENAVEVDDAEEKSVNVDLPEVRENNGNAQNIAEALAKLEDEIKETQIEELQEAPKAEEIGKVQIVPGAQVPEGFLEYGPPGFSEYGPPKDAIVPLTEVVVTPSDARRRRFSPKFRAVKRS